MLRCAKRFLNLHEYQSMQILSDFKIAIPKGKVASTPEEAAQFSKEFPSAVIKAQVLAGGRGKGHFDSGLQGGVQLTSNSAQIKEYAQKMLGHRLITKQTGAQGKPCNKVFIVEKLQLKKEYYFAILNDRKHQGPVLIASSEGGMDIEHVAATNPKAIVTQPINIHNGLTNSIARDVATKIGFSGDAIDQAVGIFQKLYKVFTEKDCTMIEINPLAELTNGKVLCMDAKLGFDDNAEFRQESIFKQRDFSQEDTREVEASKYLLNYIGLDGHVGCLVNGAGLAMATMDVLKLNGGDPANFLDVGGSASTKQVTAAFKIISSDERVDAIFVNIFGGIMKCDVIAEGIITACKTLDLKIPLIVRLQGTNVEKAKKMIASSQLPIISEDDLDKAANKAVVFSKIYSLAKSVGVNIKVE